MLTKIKEKNFIYLSSIIFLFAIIALAVISIETVMYDTIGFVIGIVSLTMLAFTVIQLNKHRKWAYWIVLILLPFIIGLFIILVNDIFFTSYAYPPRVHELEYHWYQSLWLEITVIFLIPITLFLVAFWELSKKRMYFYTNETSHQKRNHKLVSIIIFLFSIIIFIYSFGNTASPMAGPTLDKPVIYLYPTKVQDVHVQLEYDGKIIADYPQYNESIKGWDVTAYPDGHLINHRDKKEYSYLFWEGIPSQPINWDLNTGFIIRGEDTREFLQRKLQTIGLTPKEYNEFIVYWYPKMKDNPYNLIHFSGVQYTDTAPLTITPQPDSILRVFMVYRPLNAWQEVEEQHLESFERKGFTVVEWGGTEIE